MCLFEYACVCVSVYCTRTSKLDAQCAKRPKHWIHKFQSARIQYYNYIKYQPHQKTPSHHQFIYKYMFYIRLCRFAFGRFPQNDHPTLSSVRLHYCWMNKKRMNISIEIAILTWTKPNQTKPNCIVSFSRIAALDTF